MVLRVADGPRRTVAVLTAGLAASAALALVTAPSEPHGADAPTSAPEATAVGAATSARALPAGPVTAVSPGPDAIGPGTVTETAGAGLCTAGFVFTSGERTFLAQAAHCAGTGDEAETDGCTSATVPLRTPVRVHGREGTVTGSLAWSSWTTMQTRGETDPDTCAYNDLALVELPAATTTGAAVPFFGGPTGIADTPPAAGAPVYGLSNAPGPDGARTTAARAGTAAGEVGGGWGHAVYTMSPGVAGESGSPLLDDDGAAVGVLSSLTTTGDRASIEYTDLGRALDYARRTDGPTGLTLAGGAGFTSTPPGVDPRALATPAGPALGR
ncbi:trypsin-like peptidase domain-containing protein [Pseudonocardia nantongensis]|uniref:trypsin-like peptidase domain-containing protein n=1 Tax=Pseudonocardia nantongensis TaxID=1181885 RepID=UPI00397B5977